MLEAVDDLEDRGMWSATDDLRAQANGLYDSHPCVREAYVLDRRLRELRDEYESAVGLLERTVATVEAMGADDLLEKVIAGREP